MKGPFLFCVLDGWGVGAGGPGDARALARAGAKTPFLDGLVREWPTAALAASGLDVGLPAGVMGNSEVGHLNLGAGRVVDQDIVRIDREADADALADNEVVRAAAARAREGGGRLHLLGLASDGRVHSSDRHMAALLRAAARLGLPGDRTVVHAFTDGRDTPPRSGEVHLERLQRACAAAGAGVVATVSGRYYAMDRDARWDRTRLAWLALVRGEGPRAPGALEAIRAAHGAGIGDEFLVPTVLDLPGGPLVIGPRDSVLHSNFRPDRARQLTRALADPAFDAFDRGDVPRPAAFATMTLYDGTFPWPTAFPPLFVRDTLGEAWSRAGLRQLRIAETEKYAHVTYFFNGGEERAFPGEERCLVPSQRGVATYDQKPEMSAPELTAEVLKRMQARPAQAIVLNFANADMVGHTGRLEPTVAACRVVDRSVEQVVRETLRLGGFAVVTADHGNAEQMIDPKSGAPLTAHTMNPVPVHVVAAGLEGKRSRPSGLLSDVAPTMLSLMGLKAPDEMEGRSLLEEPLAP